MARRSFHVIDITEILIHWHAGRSQYELADSLGVDRKTIRKYLATDLSLGEARPSPAQPCSSRIRHVDEKNASAILVRILQSDS